MKKFMSFSVSGSADAGSSSIKAILKDNDPAIKVEYSAYSKLAGRFTVHTNYTEQADLERLYRRVKGMASHALFELGCPTFEVPKLY